MGSSNAALAYLRWQGSLTDRVRTSYIATATSGTDGGTDPWGQAAASLPVHRSRMGSVASRRRKN
jgi:hypothetical protein